MTTTHLCPVRRHRDRGYVLLVAACYGGNQSGPDDSRVDDRFDDQHHRHERSPSPTPVGPGRDHAVNNSDRVEHTVTADSGNAFNVEVDGRSTATFTAPTSRERILPLHLPPDDARTPRSSVISVASSGGQNRRLICIGPPQTMLATLYAKALDARRDQPILGDVWAAEAASHRSTTTGPRTTITAGRHRRSPPAALHFDRWAPAVPGGATPAPSSCTSARTGCAGVPAGPGPGRALGIDLDYPDVIGLRERLYPPRPTLPPDPGLGHRARLARPDARRSPGARPR